MSLNTRSKGAMQIMRRLGKYLLQSVFQKIQSGVFLSRLSVKSSTPDFSPLRALKYLLWFEINAPNISPGPIYCHLETAKQF